MPRFCFDCQNILRAVDQLFTDKEIYGFPDKQSVPNPFTGGVRGWITAATEGTCDLCSITYSSHHPDVLTRVLGDEDVMTWHVFWQWQQEDWVYLGLKSAKNNLGWCTRFQRQSMTDEEVLQLKALGSEAGSSTWGPRTAKAIRDWLETCVSSHVECRSLLTSALPMRLVDVSPAGTPIDVPITVDDVNSLSIDASPGVNLCSTVDLPSDTKYLTLSHCWGTIAFDLLSPEDGIKKSNEISRMDQIFSRAYANISATSASSGADGMIFDRKCNLYELFPCEWKKAALKKTQDGMLQEKQDYLVEHDTPGVYSRVCHRTADYSPWIVLQPGLIGSHIKYAQYESVEGIEDTKKRRQHWSQRFQDLARRYSSTLLTFPEDRLASLAGIAKSIGVHGGLNETEYFAGLWELNLPRALLWWAQNRGVKKWDPEHIGYISPSWSWAGCEAPGISFPLDHRGDRWEKLATVIHIWTEPKIPGGSRFGALSDGAITLKGRLVEMHRKRIGDAFLVSIRDGDPIFESELYFEARVPKTDAEWRSHRTGHFKQISILWDRFTKTSERAAVTALQMEAFFDLSTWDTIEPEVLYLLPIGQYCYPELVGHKDDLMIQGLVLCRDDTTGRFRRVGVFENWALYLSRFNEELRVRLLGVPETELTIV